MGEPMMTCYESVFYGRESSLTHKVGQNPFKLVLDNISLHRLGELFEPPGRVVRTSTAPYPSWRVRHRAMLEQPIMLCLEGMSASHEHHGKEQN
jgi:hypothetical protein